jgi:hypothetical protein
MAKNTFWQWSSTAASNTDIAGNGIQGSSLVSLGNDAIQAVMGQLATAFGKGADVASAGTITLGSQAYYHITGTTTITDIDFTDAVDGRMVTLIFDGALTLTHNATTLKLPGGANITTAAGDRALFVEDSGDNVTCLYYQRANGVPVLMPVSTTDNTVPRFDGTAGALQTSGVVIDDSNNITPPSNDGGALGSATVSFSDLFLATGAVVNYNNGDYTLTHSAGILTANKDLRVTTAGTNTASVVTVGGTQTLTSKTMTSPVLNAPTVGTSLLPTNDDGAALGSTSKEWSDLFLASGGVINFNNGDVTITHSTAVGGLLTFAGAAAGYSFDTPVLFASGATNAPSITFGSDSLTGFSLNLAASIDVSLAGTAYISFNASLLSPKTNDGAALGNGSFKWSDLFLASGGVVDFNNGDYTLTHSAGILTANKDLRVTTVGTNTASVVTVGGTQTLTAKTLTAPAVTNYISFPASQSASAGANDLDDYEEGTFTPAFAASGATFSYLVQTGTYTKIGNLVTFRIVLQLNTSGNTLTANTLTITGLPFTSVSGVSQAFPVLFGSTTTSYVSISASVASSATTLSVFGATAAATSNLLTTLNSDAALHATAATNYRINGTYTV